MKQRVFHSSCHKGFERGSNDKQRNKNPTDSHGRIVYIYLRGIEWLMFVDNVGYNYTWIFLLCVKFMPLHQRKPTKRQKFYISIEDPGIPVPWILFRSKPQTEQTATW